MSPRLKELLLAGVRIVLGALMAWAAITDPQHGSLRRGDRELPAAAGEPRPGLRGVPVRGGDPRGALLVAGWPSAPPRASSV